MADDPNELVYIRKDGINAVGGPVTREAFDTVHAAKGWKITTNPDDIASAAPENRSHEARAARERVTAAKAPKAATSAQ